MLGLGDVVIPGLLASMCIRCDLINAFKLGKEKAVKDGVKDDATLVAKYIEQEMTCFYFYQSLASYFIGLVATYGALSVYKTAQPALLYILPCQLIIYLASAFIRRELSRMITYDEDVELCS